MSHLLSPAGAAALALLALDRGQPEIRWILLSLCLYALLPLGVLVALLRRQRRQGGGVRDIYDPSPARRRGILRLGVATYAGSLGVLWSAGAPPVHLWAGTSFLLAAAAVGLVNRFWKISIHTTGAGGAAILIALSMPAGWPLALGLPLLVGWARLERGAHTPSQAVAGALVGGSVAWACQGLVL